MVVHRETKELPVYVVTVAKGGPKLQKAAVEEKDCPDPSGSNDPVRCHSADGGWLRGIDAKAISMEDLASLVETFEGRPALDKTGIQGLFNIRTEGWAPLRPRPPRPPGQEPTPEQAAMDLAYEDPARPTLFQIFDRFGLKLESTNAPVEVFVIERLEKPSEN